MARSSSAHTKGRSENSTGGGFASSWGIRGGSRRSSKVSASEDGHPSAPTGFADSPSTKGFDRHARMRMAMTEAQNEPVFDVASARGGGGGSRHQDYLQPGDANDGSVSPRQKIAAEQAEAKAQAAIAYAQAAARNGDIEAARAALNGEKPGEGSLTFDVLGKAGDVVLADGVPPTPVTSTSAVKSAGSAAIRPGTSGSASSAADGTRSVQGDASLSQFGRPLNESPTATRQGTLNSANASSPATIDADIKAPTESPSKGVPKATQSLLVPGEGGSVNPAGAQHRNDHLMHPSQSTSALLAGRSRKLSDASSAAGATHDSRVTPSKNKKNKPAKGGIASALAASGAGMAGMGMYDPNAVAEAHAKAAAEAANAGKKHAQAVDKDFVGSSQGGVYRDPASGLVTEKDERGRAVRQYSSRSINMSRQSSSASMTESEGSSASGLGAAANFSAMQAGALLTPTLGLGAGNAHGAPTIALDASHAEQTGTGGGTAAPGVASPRPDGGSKAVGAAVGALNETPETASTAGWPSDVGSQITGFAVASSKRNSDFHALFPTVPDDDYLIEDYGCALVREVFLQGRLYVSENHVCFFANIFGWVTNIVLPFSDIVSIEKRMTALIIPNAIQIATLHVKHTFSSLLSRDTTFDLMANIWKLSHPDVPVGAEAASAAGVSDDEHSDDDADDKESKTAEEKAAARQKKRSKLKKLMGVTSAGVKNNAGNLNGGSQPTGGEAARSDAPQAGGQNQQNGQPKRRVKHPATQCPCDSEKKHLSTIALDQTYPTTPEKMFELLFRSEFMKTFWTDNQKLFDLELGPWKGSDGAKTRDFSYIKPLAGGFGPKQTKCVITDEEQHVDFDKYITVLTTTRTPDVPSGGSFSVKTRTCLTWKGNGNFTKVYVTCATEWTGRSMLKGVIDKASIDGQKGYYKDLDVEINKHIKEHAADYKEEGDDEEEEDGGDAAAAAAAAASTSDGADKDGGSAGTKEKDVSSSSGAGAGAKDADASVLSQVIEFAKTASSTVTDLVTGAELSLGTLVLVGVVALLLVSNIWALSSSGAGRGQQRDPLDPHRLKNWQQTTAPPVHRGHYDGSSVSSPEAVAHAVRDVLRDYLEPLAHGGHFGGGSGHRSAGRATGRPHSDPQQEARELKRMIDEVEDRLTALKTQWAQLEAESQTQTGKERRLPAPASSGAA